MGIQHVHLVDLSSFTTKDTSLHGGTIGHGLVRIDATVGFLAVEEILTHPGRPEETGRTQQQICWKKFQGDLWIMKIFGKFYPSFKFAKSLC